MKIRQILPGSIASITTKDYYFDMRRVEGSGWAEETIFDYDTDGNLIRKDVGNSTVVTYKYDQHKLIKETAHSKTRPGIETAYEYNDSGLLSLKKEDGKTIERNKYQNGRLIKQWSNYYGIDPCISRPCCMQIILCFEYY